MAKFLKFSTSREAFFFLRHPALWFRRPLQVSALEAEPVEQFRKWYRSAERYGFGEFCNAMCVATVGSDGMPDARMILLKDFGAAGFVFYTNFNSKKSQDLKHADKAALVFYWGSVQRQIRIQGAVQVVTDEESDIYFASRPRSSQIGAWASLQSEELETREVLEERVREMKVRFQDQEIPRPAHWGGYRLLPERFEFWELRLSRLHDRVVYTKTRDGWSHKRLYP